MPANSYQETPAFLSVDPPPWGTRGLAYFLIVLFAFAAVGSALIRLPETVVCPFVLVPREGLDPVRASSDGFVVDVRVADAQGVEKDQQLFVIRSDAMADRSGELQALQVQLTGAQGSLANATKKYATQRLADEEEERKLKARAAHLSSKSAGTRAIQKLQREIAQTGLAIAGYAVDSIKEEITLKDRARAFAQQTLGKATKLYDANAMSELEYFQIRLEAERNNVAVHQSSRELEAAKFKMDQLKSQLESQNAESKLALEQLAIDSKENEAALAKLLRQMQIAEGDHVELERSLGETMDKSRLRIAVLTKELVGSQAGEVSVTAPRAGTVLRLRVKGSGAFVRTGDVLCELAGAAAQLQAELIVPQSRMGRITAGQRVRLLYDAFPFQRYGIRYGSVRWASPASETVQDGSAFRVLVDNDDNTIWAGGEARTLLAGMGGQAEVVVGRRSLLEYAFEPLRRLKESMAEPPAKTSHE
jgi:multidrug efflux pump subunit AcrA (membrane-fusion protein)